MKSKKKTSGWLEIGASVRGGSHVAKNIACQDANYARAINKFWRIAVVADGAGSYTHSHIGARFVVKNLYATLSETLKNKLWFIDEKLPSEIEWRESAVQALKQVYNNLKAHAKEKGLDYRQLGCTVIVSLYSEKGMLTAHIGDGRAAVLTQNHEWAATITPFKGDEVGSTLFISSDYTWEHPHHGIETQVIEGKILAFALLTDGLERYCFYCYIKAEDEDKFIDPNQPHKGFFDQNIAFIKELADRRVKKGEIKKMFKKYLKEGHPEIALESDDKTMLIGIQI